MTRLWIPSHINSFLSTQQPQHVEACEFRQPAARLLTESVTRISQRHITSSSACVSASGSAVSPKSRLQVTIPGPRLYDGDWISAVGHRALFQDLDSTQERDRQKNTFKVKNQGSYMALVLAIHPAQNALTQQSTWLQSRLNSARAPLLHLRATGDSRQQRRQFPASRSFRNSQKPERGVRKAKFPESSGVGGSNSVMLRILPPPMATTAATETSATLRRHAAIYTGLSLVAMVSQLAPSCLEP